MEYTFIEIQDFLASFSLHKQLKKLTYEKGNLKAQKDKNLSKT